MSKAKFCYFDCTDTFKTQFNTGIQRVVRNMILRLENHEGFQGYTFIPVISVGSRILALDPNFQKSYRATCFANSALGAVRNLLDRLFSRRNDDLRYLYAAEQGLPGTEPEPGNALSRLHKEIVWFCRNMVPFVLRSTLYFDTWRSGKTLVQIQKDDIFIIADAFWNADSLNAATNAKKSLAKLILVLYDIIPVTHPSLCDDNNRTIFLNYLPKYIDMVDGIISISKYTMSEIVNYCNRHGIGSNLLFDYFHLGADFSSSKYSESEIDPQLTDDLDSSKYFLMLGTLEPRKNHLFVIEAFERLWANDSELKLCIVGKIGWKCEDIIGKINKSKYLNKNLFYYKSLNDTDLEYCFENASGVIMASIVEGFGLPLIEAMHFQKSVLASDIPVFREIGGEYPVYFSLSDPRYLSDSVLSVGDGASEKDCTSQHWASWDVSVSTLLEKVISMAEAIPKQL